MSRPALWIDVVATHALHGVAWVALRLQSPAAAKATVEGLGAHLRPFATVDEARDASRAIGKRGTCLSRSLAIAARLPGSRVAIGVDPRWGGRFSAHAWVEFAGETVNPEESSLHGEVIARL